MRVSYSWLKEYLPELNIDPKELGRRMTQAGVAVDTVEEVAGDHILELDLTPNRSDCLSMWGVAREVGALLGIRVVLPQLGSLAVKGDTPLVEIQAADLCPQYLALIVRNVKVRPSPQWLSDRLTALGMRSINNIVDISNYVMLETGQPLHGFDYERLNGHRIIVRRAKPGEAIKTLDEQDRTLDTDMLIIADETHAVAVAGVMGGFESEVTDQTQTLLFESAYFQGTSVRRSGKKLGLRTEASLRFEKGADPNMLLIALQRTADLMISLQAGDPEVSVAGTGYVEVRPLEVSLRHKRLIDLLGMNVTQEQVDDVFRRLGFPYQRTEDGWVVTVPSRRQDITIEVDLIEEVARLIGLDGLTATLPAGVTTQGARTDRQKATDLLRDLLISLGLHEIITYSFVGGNDLARLYPDPTHPLRQTIAIVNPLAESQSQMRTTLLPAMLNTLAYNLNRQVSDLSLFEMGTVFYPRQLPLQELPVEEQRLTIATTGVSHGASWQHRPTDMDFFFVKGIVEAIADRFGFALRWSPINDDRYHPFRAAQVMLEHEVVGTVGELHPQVAERFAIGRHVTIADLNLSRLLKDAALTKLYGGLPRFPSATRDLALVVPEDLASDQVLHLIQESGGQLLESAHLFDVYRGAQVKEGHKSLAFGLTYRASDRTLTDQEVNTAHQQILERVNQRLGASLR